MTITAEPLCSVRSARDLRRVAHPSVPTTFVLDGRIAVTPGDAPAGDDESTIRIGFLSDMPTGSSLAEYLDPIILAFEDAMREGRLRYAVELIPSHVVGLPTGRAEHVIAAYRDVVARGSSLVLSTGVTRAGSRSARSFSPLTGGDP